MRPSGRLRFVFILFFAYSLSCCSQFGISTRASVAAQTVPAQANSLHSAECAFATALALEQACNESCVDQFFQAATMVWPDVERQLLECGRSSGRVAQIYQTSLNKLIQNGQQYCRLDFKRGLDIQTSAGRTTIPITYRGFYWQPEDFDQLLPVTRTSNEDLNHWYRCCGLGVAMIANHNRRPCELYRREQQGFAATAVLRPVSDVAGASSHFAIDMIDPLRVDSLNINGRKTQIARNLTAPLDYRMSLKNKENIKGFLHPGGTTENMGLFFAEPYQPGKIPLVFVHGLLSDPFTWVNMANELRANPELLERYQIWGFEYATGEPFLKSAAMLRQQLQEMQMRLDPTGADPALSQMVLVGHSMGGLISKLQVTQSGTTLWDAVSCRPFNEISTTSETQYLLARSFYFEPSPLVTRVVFLGTPHRGSPWAKRPVGRLGAKLVEEPSSMEKMHQQLIRDNPGVFSREFTKRIPTSIDLLKMNSKLLLSMNCMPFRDGVQIHTILGSGYWMLGGGNSDRVVPVSSARLAGAASEKAIHAKHTKINRNEDAITELFCILKQHLMECGN